MRPAASARPSAEPGSSSAATRAAAPIAGPATYASRQPWLGQFAGHLGPFTSMMMWPISAAAPLAPRSGAAAADDAAAHAGPEREHEHVARADAGPVEVLADAGGRGVVVDDDGHPEALLEVIAQRHVGERQVDRLDDAPAGEVDHGRDPHADALHAVRAVLEVGRGTPRRPRRQASADVWSVSVVNRSRISGVSTSARVRAPGSGRRPRTSAAATLVPPMSTPMTVRSGVMTPRSLPWCRLVTRGNARSRA